MSHFRDEQRALRDEQRAAIKSAVAHANAIIQPVFPARGRVPSIIRAMLSPSRRESDRPDTASN
jgi:hypothetical protein